MAGYFDDPTDYGSGAFVTIHFDTIVPENHPALLIKQFIETIDTTSFEKKYKVGKGKAGRAPKSIHMMLGVILYAVYSRIYSAHQIEKATYTFADFWIFTHKNRISHDKISDFIGRHYDDIYTVFLSTILLAEKNELLDFGTLYQDGFFIKANASKSKSYTKKKLEKKEKRVSTRLKEILELLLQSEEDDTSRKKRKDLEKQFKEIEQLKVELNNKIKERYKGKRPDKVEDEKVCINTTDNDSSIMKMKDKSYAQAYLKITAIDGKKDIIVGSIVDGYYDEPHRSVQLFKQSRENSATFGNYKKVCFDSGFNTMGTSVGYESLGVEAIAPTKKHEHENRKPDSERITFTYDENKNEVACSEGAVLQPHDQYLDKQKGTVINRFCNPIACMNCPKLKVCTSSKKGYRIVRMDSRHPIQQKVLARYKSEEGQAIYKKRSHVAETFQGDLKKNGKFDRFYTRGLHKVKIESVLHDIVWNLRRIFNSRGTEIVLE